MGTDQQNSAEFTSQQMAVSELRYRRLFEAAQDGILILDFQTGMIVDVNPYLIQMLGYSHEQFIGKAIWDLGFFKDIIPNQAKFIELNKSGYARYDNLALETSDGRRAEVEFVSNVYMVNDQKVIQCNIRDISERKRAQDALRESRLIMDGIINAIPVRVFWKDKTLVFLGCNVAFARDAVFSSPKDIIGKDDFQMAWRDQADIYRRDDREVLESGRARLLIEESQTTPEGNIITLLTSKLPLRNTAGEIYGVIGTYIDITGRKLAEEDRARLARAVDQSAETAVITDAAGTIVYANPAFETSTGYSRGEAIGRNPRFLKSGKQDAEFYRLMWEKLSHGEVWMGHFINKRKDGSLYEEEATISPMRDAAGIIVNYVAAKRDVTHEVELEGKLRQVQKMEAVGRLAGGVAHDFNNLLMGIMGYADLCRDELPEVHPARQWLEEITNGAKRSADITRQLLAFARKQAIVPKVLNINTAVDGMIKLLRRLIGEDIDLEWSPGSDVWPIQIDPSQVDQILANLCINARDAMAGVGKITMETENVVIPASDKITLTDAVPGSYVVLSVRDDGCGMDQETMAHIFEPFFTTKGIGEGTGLGLATVYGIVKQNNGVIYASSEPGKGTTFKIYLPRAVDEVVHVATMPVEAVPKGLGETILLVEDEKSLRETCSLFLKALGYKVIVAETPGEALKLVDRQADEIKLLLTDVVMPGMDGVELARRLCLSRPGLRVLFMSGYTADVMAQRGVKGQGKHFLAKPFSRDDLARKVFEVCQGSPAGLPR